ncbi:hypothetical protein [Desulfurobacterium sp.]|uniref:hypothetical protein n=1 Tax=Desulfurobacterium sp. TaxID=2004706 RepID=UPI00260357B4|nr:hypothetical protein [Desulfurobacterium sp.]
MFERYIVTPDRPFDLNGIDSGFTEGFKSKKEVEEEFQKLKKGSVSFRMFSMRKGSERF